MEKWKKLPFKGKKGEWYEVSNLGAMRKWHPGEKNPQNLKGSNISGYRVFNTKLTNGRGTSLYIHKIVAQQFVKQSTPTRNYVIHKDYNKQNNAASNLKWVDKTGLDKHHKKNPNFKQLKKAGIQERTNKLTATDVRRIKLMLKMRANRKKTIAKEFGITASQLNNIEKGLKFKFNRIYILTPLRNLKLNE